MPLRSIRLAAVPLALALLAPAAQGQSANTLTAAEQSAGWRLLFDGQTLNGWRGYKSQSVPPAWHVEKGLLTKSTGTEDIITTEMYGNFDLQLDWRLAPKGNAGVFYRGTEEYDHIYWSAPEYQLLDDKGHADGKTRLTAAGSDYAVYPSPAGYLHKPGAWNHSRILVNGNHVEHWLNGHRMVVYTLGSPNWQARVKKSKFSMFPNYGKATTGYIGIQGDHDGALALRNIKIKVLP
jgi:hypothetical protein